MRTTHPTSLLVAALVMLHHPCARGRATARLLLERAAEHAELTPAEREACRNLADDLDIERPVPIMLRTRTAPTARPAPSARTGQVVTRIFGRRTPSKSPNPEPR